MEVWYEMNAQKLLSAVTEDFIFDDPAEPQPATRETLTDYMRRWDERTRIAGSTNEWILSNQVREDKAGILTDWEWWQLAGTDLCGAALIKTDDRGVFLERITYFDRK